MIKHFDILLKTETQIAIVLLFVQVNAFLAIRFGVGQLKGHTSDINIVFTHFHFVKRHRLLNAYFSN